MKFTVTFSSGETITVESTGGKVYDLIKELVRGIQIFELDTLVKQCRRIEGQIKENQK